MMMNLGKMIKINATHSHTKIILQELRFHEKQILSGYDIKRLRSGVMVDGKITHKAYVKLKSVSKEKNTCVIEIIIHEGRNRQIRKMIESVGKGVLKLKREKYAFLDLTGLKVGEYRRLSNKEIAVLYSLVK